MVVAAVNGCVMFCSVLANFASVTAAAAIMSLKATANAEGCVAACRDGCGRQQMCFDAVVIEVPNGICVTTMSISGLLYKLGSISCVILTCLLCPAWWALRREHRVQCKDDLC